MVEGTSPGDAFPPTPQRATPARKGARCGAGAGSPPPHRPHPGHTGRGTCAARSRGRVAGGGTAPDTRRPSQRWQASPPGDGAQPPPRHAAPTGHAGQGDSVGPPHPHIRAHSTWVADPNSPLVGEQSGEGQRLTSDTPHNGGRQPPPGTPFRQPHREQRRPARVHAVGPVLGPHARTDRARDTRVAEPRLPAREVPHPGEGQRLTPDAPHNGGRNPLRGTPLRHPHSEQRRPAGAHAVGLVLGPHARTNRTRDTRVAVPWLPAPEDGLPGEGQRLTPDAPHNRGRPPPPGTAPRHPRGSQPPQGIRHGPAPRGAHSPKPGRGEPGPGRPPPSTQDGARDRGRTRGGARTTWNGPTSAQCRDRARCARHTTQGGGKRTPRERERAHTQRAPGDYQKGNRSEPPECTDRVEWRTSERGSGTPGQDGPPHAARDTRGGKGETEETQHQIPARAPRTGQKRRTDGALHPPRQ